MVVLPSTCHQQKIQNALTECKCVLLYDYYMYCCVVFNTASALLTWDVRTCLLDYSYAVNSSTIVAISYLTLTFDCFFTGLSVQVKGSWKRRPTLRNGEAKKYFPINSTVTPRRRWIRSVAHDTTPSWCPTPLTPQPTQKENQAGTGHQQDKLLQSLQDVQLVYPGSERRAARPPGRTP